MTPSIPGPDEPQWYPPQPIYQPPPPKPSSDVVGRTAIGTVTVIGVLFLIFCVLPLALCAGCGALGAFNQSADRPGDPAVYQRIEGELDCIQLQREYDLADADRQRALRRDSLYLAGVAEQYMVAAEARMGELGCP